MHDVLDPPVLRDIPVLDTGPDFPFETLILEEDRAHDLIDAATHHAPETFLKALDQISRRWLARSGNAHLDEIDEIAAKLNRSGIYFLSVNYEWGCTCRVTPSRDGRSARLIRVLDWRTPGLGRHVLAVRVAAKAGSFVTLTWPGFTGVLQAVARGRFAASLNQAPMRAPIGVYGFDWAANRGRVWRATHETPAHILREVFETATDFAEARQMLIERPMAAPAIFSLAGIRPEQTTIIERMESEARVHDGDQVAANHWQAAGWRGHARGKDSGGRACRMAAIPPSLTPNFDWLKPPILNARTRLAMVADAGEGRLVAQGYEATGPATNILQLTI